jgi:hypothetical protein
MAMLVMQVSAQRRVVVLGNNGMDPWFTATARNNYPGSMDISTAVVGVTVGHLLVGCIVARGRL